MGVTDAGAVLSGLGVVTDDAGVWLAALVGETEGDVGVPMSAVGVADGAETVGTDVALAVPVAGVGETETAIGPVGAG